MQARHSVISLAALVRCIRRSSLVNNLRAPVSFLYQTVTKISVLGGRQWFVLQQCPTRGLTPIGGMRVWVAVIAPSEG